MEAEAISSVAVAPQFPETALAMDELMAAKLLSWEQTQDWRAVTPTGHLFSVCAWTNSETA